MKRLFASLFACFLLLLAPLAGWSQDTYPGKPVRFILPFPPGGGTDILGRLIAERLSASARPAGGDREPRRRRRQRRHRGRGALRARRLHHRAGGALARDQPDAVLEAQLRPGEGLRADQPGGDGAQRDDHAARRSTPRPCRSSSRSREGEARRPEFRLGRQRHLQPPRRRAVQHRRRREAGAHPLQGREPGDAGRARAATSTSWSSASRRRRRTSRRASCARSRCVAPQRSPALPEVPTVGRSGPAGLRGHHLVRRARARAARRSHIVQPAECASWCGSCTRPR